MAYITKSKFYHAIVKKLQSNAGKKSFINKKLLVSGFSVTVLIGKLFIDEIWQEGCRSDISWSLFKIFKWKYWLILGSVEMQYAKGLKKTLKFGF